MDVRDSTWPCRILDNLPIAIVRLREDNGQPFKTYERGFPVGRIEVGLETVCNPTQASHVRLVIVCSNTLRLHASA